MAVRSGVMQALADQANESWFDDVLRATETIANHADRSNFLRRTDPTTGLLSRGALVVGARRGVAADGFHRYVIDSADLTHLAYSEPTLFASSVFSAGASVEGRGRVALVHQGGVVVVE